MFSSVPRNVLIAEAIGTFALVFVGTAAIVINDVAGSVTHVGIALVFGLIVLALIYSIGDISGAHINPAVTIAFCVAGRLPARRVLPYIVAQTIGGLVASGLVRVLFLDHELLGATLPAGPWWQSFVLEIVLTFLLMFVILNVATGSKEQGIMAGVAIGSVVGLEAMFAGPICGASMNPIRSVAPAVVAGHLQHLWLYIVAPIVGAAVAVPAWRAVQPVLNVAAVNETALNDTALKDTASKDTASNDTALKDTASNDTAPKDTASNDTAPKDAALKDAALKDTALKDTAG